MTEAILEINLSTIRKNYKILCKKCKTSNVAAVVKANGYGLGADKIAPSLESEGCRNFFVFGADEAISLRKFTEQESNIFVLSGVFANNCQELLAHNIIPVLNNLEQIEIWKNLAQQKKKKLSCILHFNTGMNRLGIPAKDIDRVISILDENYLDIIYAMSHLSSSEQPENFANKKQLDQFGRIYNHFPQIKKSLANSSGIFLGSDYHFDLVRPGAAIYGINPTPYLPESPVSNPIKLSAPIIQIQELSSGNAIGYNETFKIQNRCLIATIPVGYADGYPLSLSNKGVAYINNNQVPIVGRISMDLITIDVSMIPTEDLFLNQQVELIGQNCPPDKIANIAGTIGYEILTMLGNRYERIYTA